MEKIPVLPNFHLSIIYNVMSTLKLKLQIFSSNTNLQQKKNKINAIFDLPHLTKYSASFSQVFIILSAGYS